MFFLSCCGLLFFSGVLPMCLLYILAFRSRTCFGNFLLMSGLRFFLKVVFRNPFSGANFCFFLSCCGLLIFSGVLLMFLLYVLALANPGHVLDKFS